MISPGWSLECTITPVRLERSVHHLHRTLNSTAKLKCAFALWLALSQRWTYSVLVVYITIIQRCQPHNVSFRFHTFKYIYVLAK